MGNIRDDINVIGHFSATTMDIPANTVVNADVHANADLARTKMAQDALAVHPVDINALRVWDSLASLLPGTAAADDLEIDGGTLGTNAPMVKTGDLKAAGATTRYARFQFSLPPEYDDGETIQLRISAGMLTTIADTAATVDVECYRNDRDGTVSADICTTAAQSANSLTFANLDFTIDPTSRVAGDIFDVRIAFLVNDAATGTVVEGAIGAIEVLSDIRG